MFIKHQNADNTHLNMPKLIVFPPAGTLAASILGMFKQADTPTPTMHIYDYPGRGVSHDMVKPTKFDELCRIIHLNLQSLVTSPFILMGHSFGGYVALEIARLLQLRQNIKPDAMILSGVKNMKTFSSAYLSELLNEDDNALIKKIGLSIPEEYQGMKGSILEWLRCDVSLLATYQPKHFSTSSKLFIFNGRNDVNCSVDNGLQYWENMTVDLCQYATVEAGHPFSKSYVDAILDLRGQHIFCCKNRGR